ncbi:G-protein coupled receptor 20 [Ornithorhynchus anatinus]|uniref:G-protein coupled receptor 20 n=1 Tax=Ornithorhynchus anatinus TaxID=9258 RepID=UPI0010A86465|nr:G-protein coupled receptor 20 [Ornithorhynchus anatinus]
MQPSPSHQEEPAGPGPNCTVAPNASSLAGGTRLFSQFARLDGDLHQDFPGLWVGLVAVNALIFLVGAVLNSLALYVFCFRTKTKTTSVIYTINLVVTDLLVGLSLPTRFIIFYGTRGCERCSFVHIFGYFVNMNCSILFLTCICVDRYLAIVQLDASRRWRTPSCAKGICACIWLLAAAVTASTLTTAAPPDPCCGLFALTVFEYFLPLVTITFFTLRIMCALSRPSLMRQSRERRMRAVQLLLSVLLIFTLCFTPFHALQVAVTVQPAVPRPVRLVAHHVTVTLSSLNSCLDPVVYCFVTNSFQATVRGLFRRPEPEQSSGDAVSMHKSSRGSASPATLAPDPRGGLTPAGGTTSRPAAY